MLNCNFKFVLAGVLCSIASIAEATSLGVQVPAVYDDNAYVREKVKECVHIDEVVATSAFSAIQKKQEDTVKTSDAVEQTGRVIKLTIVGVVAAGGGGWSGAKTITVRADIYQNGDVIKSTIKSRNGRGGAFGGIKGTCAIVQNVAEVVGVDIANWYLSIEETLPSPLEEP